ncbi:MAG: hypothetical protein FH762_01215, partial [Firmicutes bacterium]|nr:hypothetical protein [Bacillota bacterium]
MDKKLSRELKFVQKVGQLKMAVLEKYKTQELRKNAKYIINEVFGIDIADDIKTALEKTVSNLKNDNLELEINNIERIKQTNYNYKVNNQNTIKAINLCLAAGLPVSLFEHAEILFNRERDKQDKKNKYIFNGTDTGSYFAAYLAVLKNKAAVIFNGPGLANITAFRGNEFLGVKKGIEYFLSDILEDSRKIESIIVGLNELGVLKNANISNKYRRNSLEINSSAVKKAVITILVRELEIEYEKASELVKENFDSKLINRKMRFIDRYKIYLQRKQGDKDQIINYIMSDNIPAVIFDDIGATLLVDKNFRIGNFGLTEGLIERISRIKEDKIKPIVERSLDSFEPYFCLVEEGNGRTAKNHLDNKPEVGDISNNLSLDYLSALIKDIILDLNRKDKKIVPELFKRSRQGHSGQFVEIIKDRLRYSMKLQGKLGSVEDDNIFRSKFFSKNPDLLTDKDRVYVLDQAVLEQFERMSFFEIESLYSWELTGKGIELILCPKTAEKEDDTTIQENNTAEWRNSDQVITYHSSDSSLKFDNQEKRLKLECQEPSKNRIYGSSRQNNYIPNKDIEYLVPEGDLYQFNNTQGVGFIISSLNTSPEKRIKIDGKTIDKQYEEKDRDEADIGNRTKTLRDTYFGENIILRDKKTTYGQLSGDLIYIYGPAKEDELIIEGFQNGDYGLQLREKVRQKEADKQAVTYTAYHK